MKEKTDFYSSLLFSLLLCLLCYDCILWITRSIHQVPGSHKQLLLAGFLIWFAVLLLPRDRNDDWAGQW